MQFHINPGDELPIYRQLMRQTIDAIAGGRLRAGDKLASHRELAEQLVIAPLTVKKAYDELERGGFIATQRGRGTFIAERVPPVDAAQQKERLRDAARRLVSQAYLNEVPVLEVVRMVEELHGELLEARAKEDRES